MQYCASQTPNLKSFFSQVSKRSRGTSMEKLMDDQNIHSIFQNQRLRTHLAASKPSSEENIPYCSEIQKHKRTIKITTRIYDNYLLNGGRPTKKKSLPQLQITSRPLPFSLIPISNRSSLKASTTRVSSQAEIRKFQFKTLFNDI